MTVKAINKQKLSIRPQSDIEKIYIGVLNDLVLSGKKPYVELQENGDLLISIENRDSVEVEETEDTAQSQGGI